MSKPRLWQPNVPRLFVPEFRWGDVDKEEIAYGTTHALRCVRVGMTFMVESAHLERDEDGEITVWKVVAVAKGEDPRTSYREALEFLWQANVDVIRYIVEDRGSARG